MNPPKGKYHQVRHLIKDGDLVFQTGYRSISAVLIRLLTRSKFWHCGFAFTMSTKLGGRLMFLEAHPRGRRLVSLSFWTNHPMIVYEAPANWDQIETNALDRVGGVKYGFMDLLGILLSETFGIERQPDFKGEVCSEMVAKALRSQGIVVPAVPSPERLWRSLDSKGALKVRCIIDPY